MTTPLLTGNPFPKFVKRYEKRALLFVQECLSIDPYPWQEEASTAYDAGQNRLSIRSGHRVGKTAWLSWIALHHLLFRYPQKTLVTAPTEDQLFDAFVPELKMWITRLPKPLQELLKVKTERIELATSPEESFLTIRTARPERPEALAGLHSEHPLVIVDEASGVHEMLYESGSGALAGEHAVMILTGNPLHNQGFFFDTHHKLSHLWWTKHVSSIDVPSVSRAYIEEMKERYGEESNAYRVRVLGEFPKRDADTVIPFEAVESATIRDIAPPAPSVPRVWGVDCAATGDDWSVLCIRQGHMVADPPHRWRIDDTMQVVGRIKAIWDVTPPSERPLEVLVDAIGIGRGVSDRLRELGLPVTAMNVSELPSLTGGCLNLRAELWLKMKDWFLQMQCKIPKDEPLIQQLTTPKLEYSSTGQMQIESKRKIKKRGFPSPDLADALMLTFGGIAATASGSWGPHKQWSEPIKRHLRSVV